VHLYLNFKLAVRVLKTCRVRSPSLFHKRLSYKSLVQVSARSTSIDRNEFTQIQGTNEPLHMHSRAFTRNNSLTGPQLLLVFPFNNSMLFISCIDMSIYGNQGARGLSFCILYLCYPSNNLTLSHWGGRADSRSISQSPSRLIFHTLLWFT